MRQIVFQLCVVGVGLVSGFSGCGPELPPIQETRSPDAPEIPNTTKEEHLASLRATLDNELPNRRGRAVRTLGRYGKEVPPDTLKKLEELAANDPEERVKADAKEAVERIKSGAESTMSKK